MTPDAAGGRYWLDRRLPRRRFLEAALLAAGAAAVSCGGSDHDGAATAGSGSGSPIPGFPPTAVSTIPGGYAASVWAELAPTQAPSPRYDHAMVLDGAGQTAYLFGGEGQFGVQDDLWAFDVGTQQWERMLLSGAGPSARAGHVLAFDNATRRLVIFGGRGEGGGLLEDLWTIETATFTARQLRTNGPSARQYIAAAIDLSSRRLLVAFGLGADGIASDTWTFDLQTGSWAPLATGDQAPTPRWGAEAAWDAAAARLVFFGGQDAEKSLPVDFWSLDLAGGTWESVRLAIQPPGRTGFLLIPNEEDQSLLAFGGNTLTGLAADVWLYDEKRQEWGKGKAQPREAPKREGHCGIYDPHRRSLIIFGGRGENGLLGDTWELGLGAPGA